MTAECPELPVWLEKADIHAREMKMELIPVHLLEILSHYRRAENKDLDCAEVLAERYESGDLPCGASLTEAIRWHEYAADIGSVKSALRLARLNTWLSETRNMGSVKVKAAKALNNALKDKYVYQENLNMAAQAALLLLEYKPNESEILLIEELLESKKFAAHTDYVVIRDGVRLAQCQRGNSSLSLKVASAKISEDNEFKAGIYRSLEHPLPLVELPNVDFVKKTLDEEFPWFSAINEQIYRQLIVQQHSSMPAFKLRPLLLAGPPGTGKTTYVKRLAELAGVPFRSVMAGGGSDSMFLRGTPRGWSTSRPGAVIQAMATEGIANPLLLVDELEKASPDNRNGRIWDVLLQMLEPATSKVYLDECLQVACDLSWVSWIATVNEIGALPRPLLERFTVIVVQPPGSEHFETLVTGVVTSFAKELGIDARMLPSLDNDNLDVLRRCNGPREISRTARMMIEKKLVDDRRKMRRN